MDTFIKAFATSNNSSLAQEREKEHALTALLGDFLIRVFVFTG
jgi:hypothetical protein